jgi:hypothetical protein
VDHFLVQWQVEGISTYRQVLFYARVTYIPEKGRGKLNTKFPFKTVYFLGVRGLTTSSYIAYDFTSSGHTDLWSTYTLYLQYRYISIKYI